MPLPAQAGEPEVKAATGFLKECRDKPVLLIIHSQADADAVAAAAALADYLHNAVVCVPDVLSSPGKRVRDRFGVKIVNFKELAFSPSALILLDSNSAALFPGITDYFPNFNGRTAIIDHHSLHDDALRADVVFVDNRASSTCEIIYELFRELNYPVSQRIAEILLAGILADSADFLHASTRTFEVVAYLLKRTPLSLAQIREVVEGVPSPEYRLAILKALAHLRISRAGNFLIVVSATNTLEAVSAEKLISLGADYSFVAQVTTKELRISARCRPSLVDSCGADVASIMGEVGRFIGGSGGGHPAAAGANGPYIERLDDALKLACTLAREQLKKAGCIKSSGARECEYLEI